MTEPTSPEAAIAAVAKAFLTPRRTATANVPLVLPGGRPLRVDTADGRLAALAAGAGPTVLLVHGWEGQASDLSSLATALLRARFRVIAVDLPAHGASDGTSTSIPAAARALLALQRQVGVFHAVVAHSVGAAVSVEAMAQGLAVRRVALIGAPARYRDYAEAFADQAGLDRTQTDLMIAALLQMDVDVAAVSLPARAAQLSQPALFVHSVDDRVVAFADAIDNSHAWPGARLLRVDGLGHRRVLHDPVVVAAAVDFVAAHAHIDTPQPVPA